MGMEKAVQAQIGIQLKKGQGETNDRLDALLAEQRRTNELLTWVGQCIQAQSAEGIAHARGAE